MTTELLVREARRYFSEENLIIDSLISSIERLVVDSDWEYVSNTDGEYGYESWVELGYGQPGDLEPEPVIVFCTCSSEPGCITAKSYRYL